MWIKSHHKVYLLVFLVIYFGVLCFFLSLTKKLFPGLKLTAISRTIFVCVATSGFYYLLYKLFLEEKLPIDSELKTKEKKKTPCEKKP